MTATPGSAEVLLRDLWNELVEKTDRTSPEEYPDMALITFDELREFLARLAAKPAEEVRISPYLLQYLIAFIEDSGLLALSPAKSPFGRMTRHDAAQKLRTLSPTQEPKP